MLDDKSLAEIRERAERATPGPWMWDMRTGQRTCMLTTAHSGRYFVMTFDRWGMNDACPSFLACEKYEGPVGARGALGTVRADKLAKSLPGKEHHNGFDDFIDHPDAIFIEHAPEDVNRLLAEHARLTDENARLAWELGAAKGDMRNYMERNIHETHGRFACDLCEHGGEYETADPTKCPDGCDGINRWQWRGVCPANTPPVEMGAPFDEPILANTPDARESNLQNAQSGDAREGNV